jgi:hypothetical protein
MHARAAEGIEDVQRFYLVLSPHSEHHHRLLLVGPKKLPSSGSDGQR